MTALPDGGRHGRGRAQTRRQLVRFLLVGGSNTAITAALLIVLQTWWSAPVAYTVTYVVGMVYSAAVTGQVVFGARWSVRASTVYLGWYLLVYAVGLGAVHLVERLGHPSAWQIAALTVAVTAPLSFVGGRLIFARPGRIRTGTGFPADR